MCAVFKHFSLPNILYLFKFLSVRILLELHIKIMKQSLHFTTFSINHSIITFHSSLYNLRAGPRDSAVWGVDLDHLDAETVDSNPA
jgi:hypothetical protein